jgi:hypothetical protein
MTTGPGRYDDICTVARESAQARAAIVLIFEGNRGNGFSMQVEGTPNMRRMLRDLPAILRGMADEIETDVATRQ